MALLQAKSLGEQLYDIILNRIFNGTYLPGQKLSINQMAVEFEVSRSPINDALNKLCGAGYVELNQRIGFSIRSITKNQMLKLYDYRKMIDLYVAQTLRIFNNDSLVESLNNVLGQGEALCKSDKPEDVIRFLALDELFHSLFVSAVDNEFITKDYENANFLLRIAKIHYLEARRASSSVITEHRRILDSIVSGDSEKLMASIEFHYEQVNTRFSTH